MPLALALSRLPLVIATMWRNYQVRGVCLFAADATTSVTVKKNLPRNRRLFRRQPDFFPPAPTRIDCFCKNRQNAPNSRNDQCGRSLQ